MRLPFPLRERASIFFVRLLLATLCVASAALPVRDAWATNIFGADLVGFGLYRTAKSGEAKNDKVRTGKVMLVDVIHNIRRDVNIPLTTDAEFGLEFVIKGVPEGSPVPVRVNLSHPFVMDPSTGASHAEAEWEMHPPMGEPIYTGWSFSQPWEMAEGEWIFRIYHDDRLLLEKAFNLYKPEEKAAPEDELVISLDTGPAAPRPSPPPAKAAVAAEPAKPESDSPYKAAEMKAKAEEPPVYVVQAGAFLHLAHAKKLLNKLKKHGYSPRHLALYDKRDRLFHIVILDRYDTRKEADAAAKAYRDKTGKKPFVMKMNWDLYKTALSR